MFDRDEQQSHKKLQAYFFKKTSNFVFGRVLLCKCFQLLIIFLVFQALILSYFSYSPPKQKQTPTREAVGEQTEPLPEKEKCESGRFYVYELPEFFNREILVNCHDLDPWHSRCNAVSNGGLGPRVTGPGRRSDGHGRVVPGNLSSAWYWTDMFAGEIIHHERMLRHECRTAAPEYAAAFYIPFYAGLAVARYLFTNYTAKDRDRQCEMLLRWVAEQPYWARSNGSDHFIMLGRMSWDFRRRKDEDWGSSFINMPLMKNILRLSVEKDPWDQLEISVPYPTGFHPRSKSELNQWLRFVQAHKRRHLFTFVGAKRPLIGDFRTILLNHCHNESGSCRVVDCSGTRCYDGTWEILESFLESDFCLQPRGDAHTRKSTFDCMLAGSIPVFFWRRSIKYQYEWFLGHEPDDFSVFIDRRAVRNGTSIRKVLEGYSKDKVREMRQRIISLIPKFVYRYTNSDDFRDYKDAFDITIDGVLRRFKEQKGSTNTTNGGTTS
ncbi:hypothetical protein F511_36055 [Dorcoceras hygrometricum]|uniref:Exostosin GT47 domain-containing protein n=1 Tax=Dorcoceras hygrometricum TaxID=472368 RepID=A0A2Z7C7I0_9LAMI|nr:hypothetical protein F511_36055 [Dorcoceras hygrometricum]